MKTPVYFVIYHTNPIQNGFLIKHIDKVIKGDLEDYEKFYHENIRNVEQYPPFYLSMEIVARPDNSILEEKANE